MTDSNGYKLTVELVPQSLWYTNVRSMVSPERWNELRRESYKKAGYVCEICNEVGKTHPVECHEVWEYDDEKKIQKLVKLISLCPMCHKCKHLGRSLYVDRDETVIDHFLTVNKISLEEALDYFKAVFKVYRVRSEHKWSTDISVIECEERQE